MIIYQRGGTMIVKLFLLLILGFTLQVSDSTDSTHEHEGEIRGIVQLPETRAAQSSPVGRYRRGVQRQAQSQSPVLIWVIEQNQQQTQQNEPVILDQQDLEFTPNIIAVRQNDVVRIRNSDPVYHNVFSLSSVKRFDVGRRPQGEYLDVKFEQQGVVDVFCDIHSNMHATIYVVEPEMYSWVAGNSGDEFSLGSLPDGQYVLKIFSPGFSLYTSNLSVNEGEVKDLGTITLRQ